MLSHRDKEEKKFLKKHEGTLVPERMYGLLQKMHMKKD